MWYIFALISGFLSAVLAILVRIHLKHLNPFFITFLFFIIAALLLFIFDLATHKINCPLVTSLSAKELILLVIAGVLNGLSFTAYVTALSCGKTSSVVAVDRLGVLFVVILSLIFLQEKLTALSIVGSLLMIIGAACLSS
jgi:bacterial/archaeal transporter family protein